MPPLIVRKPRSRRIADRIAYAKLVAESLKDNPYFPDPIPALARLVVHIAAADVAHVAASTREAGTAATLAAAVRAVEGDLESLHVHVQSIASLDPTNGPAIVASAGMSLKDARGREPLAAALCPFEAELGEFEADRGSFEEPLREGLAGRNPRAERPRFSRPSRRGSARTSRPRGSSKASRTGHRLRQDCAARDAPPELSAPRAR
jgi:hypothetical protein